MSDCLCYTASGVSEFIYTCYSRQETTRQDGEGKRTCQQRFRLRWISVKLFMIIVMCCHKTYIHVLIYLIHLLNMPDGSNAHSNKIQY